MINKKRAPVKETWGPELNTPKGTGVKDKEEKKAKACCRNN